MKQQTLHLKAPDNWVNDPNGFIYYKGWYHLFYQYFPYGSRWGTMHWGHAVSRDLVTWEHRGIALYPSVREDQNGCFSGSAIEADGRLYLVYTGVRSEVVNPEDPHTCLDEKFESAQLMISSDDGFGFDNENGKTVIIPPIRNPEIGHRTHTRDPKIWRGKDAWYLILGSTVDEKYGEVLFYRSRDLYTWEYVNKAWKGEDYGWMWECPDYFEINGGGILMVSPMGLLQNGEKEKNQSICFAVQFEENSCRMEIPDQYQFADYGMDLYAPQTTVDAQGRRIMEAWIRMPQPTADGWIGMFSSPRVLELKDGHIYFHMHPNLRAAYGKEIPAASIAAAEGCMAVFELYDGEQANIGGFIICRKGNRIYTDRTAVYPGFDGAHLKSETPEIKDGFHLEVLVDQSLVEVYVNDGEYVISNAVYGLGSAIDFDRRDGMKLYTAGK